MTTFLLSYDVRSTNHNYAPLYALLQSWKAAHLQNSVWLADLVGSASAIRDFMLTHMHADDTVAVIEVDQKPDWAIRNVRPDGVSWLKAHNP